MQLFSCCNIANVSQCVTSTGIFLSWLLLALIKVPLWLPPVLLLLLPLLPLLGWVLKAAVDLLWLESVCQCHIPTHHLHCL
jgi:hypothetical protein